MWIQDLDIMIAEDLRLSEGLSKEEAFTKAREIIADKNRTLKNERRQVR